MRRLVKAVPGGRVNTTNDLLSAIALVLAREVELKDVDVNPQEEATIFPTKATLRSFGEVGSTYWTLFRSGKKSLQRTFGHAEGYRRLVSLTFDLNGYLAMDQGEPNWRAWNDYVDDVTDAIEASRKLGGTVHDIPPPEATVYPIRTANRGGTPFRYLSALIRFTILDENRLLFPISEPAPAEAAING